MASVASQGTTGRRRTTPLTYSWEKGYMLAGPAFFLMAAILLYPLAYSFVMSFFRWDLSGSAPFVGLANYLEEISGRRFQQAFRNQMIFSAISIGAELVAGMAIAVLINTKMKGIRLATTLLLIPPMIAPTVVGLNFRWLFNTQFGLVDALLRMVGLPDAPWLTDPSWAMASVIIADVWQNTPLMVLLFLAGLKSIPEEPLEAALVDGASAWDIFWLIILPLLKPVILIALMLRIIDTFRSFDIIWLMTEGGPGGATMTLTVYAYQTAFKSADFGHASAVSYIALFLSFIFLGLLYVVPWLWSRLRSK